MSLLRLGADCEGLVLVAESDLILTSAAPLLYFVPTLLGHAVGGMGDLVGGFADVGDLTDKRGLADAATAIGRLTKVVRARGQRLLARDSSGGLLGLPNCRFANHCRFGGSLASFGLRRGAR